MMRYALLTTASRLLLLDLHARKFATVESGRPEYYGVTWAPTSKDLILTHSNLDNETTVDLAAYARSEVGTVSVGKSTTRRFLSCPHQACHAPDGRIVCTNTGRNAVNVIDPARHNYLQEASISPARWDRLSAEHRDGDHMNSVFFRGDQLHVMAHRFDRGSQLATFSYPELELLTLEDLPGFTGLHNIWITPEGRRLCCDSHRGGVADLDSRALLWAAPTPIYTRGLAASAEHVVVGESLRTNRHLRKTSMSGVWLLDRRTWQPLEHIRLGPFGAVHEVRILDVPDEAHHGAPFAGLADLLGRIAPEDWRDWANETNPDLIFGEPVSQGDGWLKSAGTPCMLRPHGLGEELSFAYEFSQPREGIIAEVGIVTAYEGNGEDDAMTLLSIKPTHDGKAKLRGWQVRDGRRKRLRTWQRPFGLRLDDLPAAGTMTVRSQAKNMTLFVDGRPIGTFPAGLLDAIEGKAAIGLRWQGAAIKVLAAPKA